MARLDSGHDIELPHSYVHCILGDFLNKLYSVPILLRHDTSSSVLQLATALGCVDCTKQV